MIIKEKYALKQGYTMGTVKPEDVEVVTSLFNQFSQAVIHENEETVSEIASFWETPGINMADDIRTVTDPQGRVVGYVEALTFQNPPVHPFVWLRLHPTLDTGNAGPVLMGWAIQRASHVLDKLAPDLRVSIFTHNFGGYEPIHELYESFGFRLMRHSFMMHRVMQELPEAPVWPSGIALRPFDLERDAEAVYRADDEAFSDHFGHIEMPFELGFAQFKHNMIDNKERFDPSLWHIAMDGDQIAGFSICSIDHSDPNEPIGWVHALGVRRAWRKRGLGMALLLHSFGEFYRRGYRKAGLGVDASNLTGALRLYERAGMSVFRRYDRYELELRPGKELMTTGVNQ